MGEETRTVVREGANGSSLMFERAIAAKLKKMVEGTINSCIDDIDISDEMSEALQEIVEEIMTEARFKARIKAKINVLLDEDAFVTKMAQKVINKVMGS